MSTIWYNAVYLGCKYDSAMMDRVGNPETLVTTKPIKQMSMASAVHTVNKMVSNLAAPPLSRGKSRANSTIELTAARCILPHPPSFPLVLLPLSIRLARGPRRGNAKSKA